MDKEKVGIVACSNAQSEKQREEIDRLCQVLNDLHQMPVLSPCLFAKQEPFSGTGQERAEALMKFYENPDITAIYDVSGGDIANEILEYLDEALIKNSPAVFWGYSDLTTVINAIYTLTGKSSVLYQIKNLVWDYAKEQQERFCHMQELFQIETEFVQGDSMSGVLVGGNIRCFLKLAGTRFFPSLEGKLLLLEALGGEVPQMVTYLSQLRQMGAFEKVNGVLLGTFSMMEAKGAVPDISELVRQYAGTELPIARTREIGHGMDAKAVRIGAFYSL